MDRRCAVRTVLPLHVVGIKASIEKDGHFQVESIDTNLKECEDDERGTYTSDKQQSAKALSWTRLECSICFHGRVLPVLARHVRTFMRS